MNFQDKGEEPGNDVQNGVVMVRATQGRMHLKRTKFTRSVYNTMTFA